MLRDFSAGCSIPKVEDRRTELCVFFCAKSRGLAVVRSGVRRFRAHSCVEYFLMVLAAQILNGGPIFRRPFFFAPFFFWRPSVLVQERKKERSAAMRTGREQDPRPQKECWVATP